MTTVLKPGVITALVTPFREGKVDWSAWTQLLEFQARSHIAGVVVAGTTGESPTLTPDEWKRLLETAVQHKREMTVIAGVGGNNTSKVIEACLQARDLGADSVLAVTPYYNKPPQWAVIEHYRAVAASCPLPIILYNVPGRTQVDLLPATTAELMNCKNILGIKEASGDVTRVASYSSNETTKHLSIYSGDDPLWLPSLERGACGIISVVSNILPQPMVDIERAFRSKDLNKARQLAVSLEPLLKILFSVTNPIGVKWFGSQMKFWTDECRLPLVSLTLGPAKVRAEFETFWARSKELVTSGMLNR